MGESREQRRGAARRRLSVWGGVRRRALRGGRAQRLPDGSAAGGAALHSRGTHGRVAEMPARRAPSAASNNTASGARDDDVPEGVSRVRLGARDGAALEGHLLGRRAASEGAWSAPDQRASLRAWPIGEVDFIQPHLLIRKFDSWLQRQNFGGTPSSGEAMIAQNRSR
jgi:hypothetical protein